MKKSIISGILAGTAVLMLVQPAAAAPQNTGAGVSTQTVETWNTLKAYSVDKKNEAVAYGRQLMKDTDARIAQLEPKAAKASGEAKAQYEKEVKDLKLTQARAAAKLDKMEKDSGSAWNDAKQGFADAYRDLQNAYDKAASQFK